MAPTPIPAPGGGDMEIPLSQMRKGIAAKMTRVKQTVPHAYTVVEVDMSNVVRWRETNTAAYKAREGIGISYVAVVIKAVTETLRQHPMINSQFAEDRVIRKCLPDLRTQCALGGFVRLGDGCPVVLGARGDPAGETVEGDLVGYVGEVVREGELGLPTHR